MKTERRGEKEGREGEREKRKKEMEERLGRRKRQKKRKICTGIGKTDVLFWHIQLVHRKCVYQVLSAVPLNVMQATVWTSGRPDVVFLLCLGTRNLIFTSQTPLKCTL